MFNACKRGTASLCTLAGAATPSITSRFIRSSRFCLIAQRLPKPIAGCRSLHVSTSLLEPDFKREGGYRREGNRDRDSRSGGFQRGRGGVGGGGGGGFRSGGGAFRSGGGSDRRRPRFAVEYETGGDPVEGTGEYKPTYRDFKELEDAGLVNPALIKAITDMGITRMTDVQAMTIEQTIKGEDAIAQARTGTGKTIGFLLPILNNVLECSPKLAVPLAPVSGRNRRGPKPVTDIRAIIMSPTRELAEQISVECRKMTRHTSLVTQLAVGGTGKRDMLQKMRDEGCHILVATPGRLNDLLTDKYSRVRADNLKALVLDEADRLLDDGFAVEIQDIIKVLPDRESVDRQTLLFSATVPKEVMKLVGRTLKPNFHFVQTVKAGEQSTHERIPQHLIACKGFENMMPTLLELCKRELAISKSGEAKAPFKAIVYFNSTANVELSSEIFSNLKEGASLFGKHPLHPAMISEIHGKLTQNQRTRVTDRFRRASSAILFSSDVTARGMDFPNVTHVIQIGVPSRQDSYIHRIGRTGRGDKTGEGWLIATEQELSGADRRLKGLPIKSNTEFAAAQVDMTQDAQLSAEVAASLAQVADATKMVGREVKFAAYMASVGSVEISNKNALIESLNRWTRYGWGWEAPPSINPMLASKMGIKGYSSTRSIGGDSFGRSDSRGSRGGPSSREERGGYRGRVEPVERSGNGGREDRGGHGGRERREREKY